LIFLETFFIYLTKLSVDNLVLHLSKYVDLVHFETLDQFNPPSFSEFWN